VICVSSNPTLTLLELNMTWVDSTPGLPPTTVSIFFTHEGQVNASVVNLTVCMVSSCDVDPLMGEAVTPFQRIARGRALTQVKCAETGYSAAARASLSIRSMWRPLTRTHPSVSN